MDIDRNTYTHMLRSHDFHARETALEVFLHSRQYNDEVLALVAQIARIDDSNTVRRSAVALLDYAKAEVHEDALFACLADSDYIVRGRAYTALRNVGIADSDPRLVEYAQNETHAYGLHCISHHQN